MLKKSLSATANLLASVNNFPARMIQKFAEIVPEEVRAMFIELFDESKDVYERINSFKLKSSLLLERYGNGAAQHYQNENSISTYLWLLYPDKYYIFKLSEVKVVASELESDYRFKKGVYADNIHNFYAFTMKSAPSSRRMMSSGICWPPKLTAPAIQTQRCGL